MENKPVSVRVMLVAVPTEELPEGWEIDPKILTSGPSKEAVMEYWEEHHCDTDWEGFGIEVYLVDLTTNKAIERLA